MDMNDFYNTYKDIRNTFESQNLNLTPEEFLSLTNMRGIKFLPFKYVNENYSFTPYDSNVSESLNSKLKTGLNGKFVFSCKDDKIPILPNGYVLPFVSRVKENISTTFNKIIPFSTKADIGKDNKLPQYSLPSYMTLEKVFVPPNFSDVINELKNFRGDNPDNILSKLIKIMETNGLNDSNDCKKTSVKIAASNTENRKKDFQIELKRINGDFKNKFLPKGQLINRKGAMQYIQRLYKQKLKEGVFVDNEGQPIRTATKLVFALNLIPNDPKKSMDLLIRALSQDGVSNILERKKELSKEIISQEQAKIGEFGDDELFEKYGGGGDIEVQYGGAEDTAKAEQIIKDTVNLLNNQNMITIYGKTKDTFISDLESAETSYDPDEPEPTVATSTSMVKSGVGPGTGFGSGTGSASDFISNLFNKGSMGSSSSTGMGSGSDSCGNNTSIMCAGDDLVVTVTLKLNELIASCMNHKSIQNYGSQPGDLKKITNDEEGGADFTSTEPAPPKPVVNDAAKPVVTGAATAPSNSVVNDDQPDAPVVPAGTDVQTDAPVVPAGTDKPAGAAPLGSDAAPANPPDAAPADANPAAPDVSADTATLIAKTKELLDELNQLVILRNTTETESITKVDTEIRSKASTLDITGKEGINETTLNTFRKLFKDSSQDKTTKQLSEITKQLSKIVEKNYEIFIDTVIPIIKKILTDLVTNLSAQLADKKLQINEFVANLKKIEEYLKDSKDTTPTLGEEEKKVYDDATAFIGEQEEMITYANNPPSTETAFKGDEIKMHIISIIINSLAAELKKTNIEDDEALAALITKENVPDDLKVKAGGNNNNNSNNKTKNNRKSNKNKTKKRKGKKSNSRKFKFVKLKKV